MQLLAGYRCVVVVVAAAGRPLVIAWRSEAQPGAAMLYCQ